MEDYITIKYVIGAVLYSGIGMLILGVAWKLFDRLTPGELWKELIEHRNIALAIVVGSVTLAVAHIIASAIHG